MTAPSVHMDPQLAPALALSQLLSEHPVRPLTTWSILNDRLEGRVFGPEAGGEQAVAWWADVLGAVPVPWGFYEYDGQRLREFEVSATWRDVRVVVLVAVPVVLEPSALVLSDGTVLAAADLPGAA